MARHEQLSVGELTADIVRGQVVGDVTGNVTGNVTGDVMELVAQRT